jgi:hypothetical protein
LAGATAVVLVLGVHFDVGVEADSGESRSGDQGGNSHGELGFADHGQTPLSLREVAEYSTFGDSGSEQ